MSESVNVTNAILDKKMESYNFESNNFIAEGEIVITITLNEYRNLISEVAKKQVDIEKANKDKYARDSENEKLRKEVNDLRSQLFELTRKKDAESEEE
jgi:hypothetical protein